MGVVSRWGGLVVGWDGCWGGKVGGGCYEPFFCFVGPAFAILSGFARVLCLVFLNSGADLEFAKLRCSFLAGLL